MGRSEGDVGRSGDAVGNTCEEDVGKTVEKIHVPHFPHYFPNCSELLCPPSRSSLPCTDVQFVMIYYQCHFKVGQKREIDSKWCRNATLTSDPSMVENFATATLTDVIICI